MRFPRVPGVSTPSVGGDVSRSRADHGYSRGNGMEAEGGGGEGEERRRAFADVFFRDVRSRARMHARRGFRSCGIAGVSRARASANSSRSICGIDRYRLERTGRPIGGAGKAKRNDVFGNAPLPPPALAEIVSRRDSPWFVFAFRTRTNSRGGASGDSVSSHCAKRAIAERAEGEICSSAPASSTSGETRNIPRERQFGRETFVGSVFGT